MSERTDRSSRTDRSGTAGKPADPDGAPDPEGAPDRDRVAGRATSETWSSKPEVDGRRAAAPALGLRGTLLFLWRQLTSMQTALILLMLLAIAAVPGSLYPQRNVNPALTEQFLEENGRWGEILDALGAFDVFSSPWFSAIYLLLFVSLIGCIIPRVGVHLRQLRAKPPRIPSRLTRFTGHTRLELPGADADALLQRAHRSLRRSRYRTDVREETGSRSVSAERGLLRETGNLLFHVALVGVLIFIAADQLLGYHGQVTVIEGDGISNSLTQYDSFRSGAWFDPSGMEPFRLTLEDFRVTYVEPGETGAVGEPRSFEADVEVATPGGGTLARTVQVNRPLHITGTSIYLLGNGYAPEITVTDPTGAVVAAGPVITVPLGDMGYTSQVVIKAPDAEPEQTAVVGYFMPTGTIDEQGPRSLYPDTLDPQLALTVHQGDLGLDDGIPRNAYEIDVSTLTPVTGEDGNPALVSLSPGQETELPDGTTVGFEGVRRFAAFDIAHNPFEPWILASALTAIGGLILSLFVPRRRVWVRVRATEDGAVLEMAGLARSDDPALEGDVRALAWELAKEQDGPRDGRRAPAPERPVRTTDDTPGGSAQ